jgi:methylmalonyl-CoA/ethylmalonyl-CoA epimerase
MPPDTRAARTVADASAARDVVVDNPAAARRIDHVGVVVRDVEVAAREFVERHGMTVTGVADLADGTARLLYLRAGDTTLQLVQPLLAGSLADYLAAHGEGLHHVCFAVDTLEPALDALPGEADRVNGISMGGRGCRVVFLGARPAGVLIELTEMAAPDGPGGRDGTGPALDREVR